MTGLVIRDALNRLMVDMTMSISQHMGSVVTGGANGSATIPAPPSGKTAYFIVVPLVDLQGPNGAKPGVTLSGTALSWRYQHAGESWGFFNANCEIFYGYY